MGYLIVFFQFWCIFIYYFRKTDELQRNKGLTWLYLLPRLNLYSLYISLMFLHFVVRSISVFPGHFSSHPFRFFCFIYTFSSSLLPFVLCCFPFFRRCFHFIHYFSGKKRVFSVVWCRSSTQQKPEKGENSNRYDSLNDLRKSVDYKTRNVCLSTFIKRTVTIRQRKVFYQTLFHLNPFKFLNVWNPRKKKRNNNSR